MGQLRAVVAVRLSDFADSSTSPERQTDAGERVARDIGARVVGYPVDLDVSASKTTPWERPELSEWLGRPDDFDVMIWWRLDRAVRSMTDMSALGQWARQHRKRLIFAEGPTGGRLELDMASPVGELMAIFMAFAAQMEAQAIRERVIGSRAELRRVGRWGGGVPPYGTQPIPSPHGSGTVLGEDPEAAQVIRYGAKLLLAGMRPHAIALHFNDMAIPSASLHSALQQGISTKTAGRWVGHGFKRIMRSPSLLGYAVHDGTIVRDEDGSPVIVGPEILTRSEYDAVGVVLAAMGHDHVTIPRADSHARCRGVAKCGGCGSNIYLEKSLGSRRSRYVCRTGTRGTKCPSPASIRASWLDDYAEREFLRRFGGMEVHRIVSHGGYDPGPELDDVTRELQIMIARMSEAKTKTTQAVWEERVAALEARAAALEATPVREDYEERVATGETYADVWARADDIGKRQILMDVGARIIVHRAEVSEGKSRPGRVYEIPESRMEFETGADRDPVADAEDDAQYQADL